MTDFSIKFSKFIKKSEHIAILTHRNADGDAVGAVLALSKVIGLQKLVDIFVPDPVSKNLSFISGVEKIKVGLPRKNYDLIIILDAANLEQAGLEPKNLPKTPIINIDHHPTNTQFGQLNYIEPKAAATCEILYNLFQAMKVKLDKEIATYLMIGIFTDTGGFKHSNTSQKVLRISAELLKYGLNLAKIYKEIYQKKSVPALKLWGLVFERIRLNDGFAWAVITQKDFKNLGANQDDTEGLVEVLAGIPEAKAAMLITEEDGMIKGSLRAGAADTDVSALALILGGGGHKKAAGFRIPGKIERVGEQVRIV